ncbi:MAG: energy-coupling factor transporter transmembrane protein EcfT [Mycoplasma sp.]|nr:energy-coupling factor transporter transmembrane protein EcfT [Mycoplasma sp.]
MFAAKVGQFIPSNSIIHRLDPRLKIIGNIVFIILIFYTKNVLIQLILTLVSIFLFLLSSFKKRQLLATLKPTLYITVFIMIISLIMLKTDDQRFIRGTDKIDGQGYIFYKDKYIEINSVMINNTILIGLRIYTMILMTSLLTATTSPLDLTKSLEDLMWPLKIFRIIPVHIIAMIISIALRFIPTLIGEANRIMKAQASRGVDFKNGGFKTKIKSLLTLIIPLFVSAFNKAEDLANAMEARGYDPYAERTRYKIFRIKWFDLIAFIFLLGLIALVITSNWKVGEEIREIILYPGYFKDGVKLYWNGSKTLLDLPDLLKYGLK